MKYILRQLLPTACRVVKIRNFPEQTCLQTAPQFCTYTDLNMISSQLATHAMEEMRAGCAEVGALHGHLKQH